MTENQMSKPPCRTYILKDCSKLNAEGNVCYEGDTKKELNDENEINTIWESLCKIGRRRDNQDNEKEESGSFFRLIGDKIDERENDQTELVRYFMGEKYSGKYAGLVMDEDENGENVYFFYSRFDKDENYNFTNYILSRTLHTNSRIFPDMHIHRANDQILHRLLAIIFAEQICAAYKHGIFRCYRNFEENNSRVRGRIQVERNIKLNPLFNGKVAYTYREYTPDNDVNRIILTAYDQLCRGNGAFMRQLLNSSKYREVKDFFIQLSNITAPASRQEVPQLLKNNKQKIRHSVYRDWEPVRKTAIQILRCMGIRTQESGQIEITGILIDMTKVWEEYLEEVLNGSDIKFEAQKEHEILEGKKALKPDFLNMEKRVVMDAKYKNRWEEIAEKGKGNSSWQGVREDTFQLLSYMYVFNCDTGIILCPLPTKKNRIISCPISMEKEGISEEELKKELAAASAAKYSISNEYGQLKGKSIYVLPLMIPAEERMSYEEFVVLMNKSEEVLRTTLMNVLNTLSDASAHSEE